MARIHITGASGTGTTTLGRALALRLGTPHFDSDDYYWIPTWPPYAIKRDPGVRDARLREDLTRFDAWIWSGSALSWEVDAPMTLCVFLHLPTELRIERLRRREQAELRTMPGLSEVEIDRRIQEFLDWAAAYESGDREGRSRARHEAWLASLACPVLRLTDDETTEQRLHRVLDAC